MKIRFVRPWPCIADKEGTFQLHAVNYGPFGFTLAEMIETGFKVPPPKPRMVICVIHNDKLRGSVGTRLCEAEFESCDSADTAMREGVDVVADAMVQSFAKRAVAAEVAEIVI